MLEAFGSFWASAFKEVIVFTLILPVLLWRSLRDPPCRRRVTHADANVPTAAGAPRPRVTCAAAILGAFVALLRSRCRSCRCPTSGSPRLNYIGLYALVALGLVLLTGVGGLTSFGQAAFVGIGAYTTAYLTTDARPVAVADAVRSAWRSPAPVALVLGWITLRMSGHYLPLATIAWGLSLYYLIGNLECAGQVRRHPRRAGLIAASAIDFGHGPHASSS